MTESWRRPPTSSPIEFTIDPKGEHAPFEQLKAQIVERVSSGELIAGTKLPAVRQLASGLGVAPNTVARAYRELEADGFLETRGRNGTVVKAKSGDADALLQVAATEYAARAATLGVPADRALEYVRSALG
ncbi:DNA-binding transcriptional regulator YhcF (GntR family) [Microbacteriaceae bacterium SG_E_30_P1]|uniref:DNA-binding transcriptional regulator YhcF (GntR family) n=1 Tax=Antiquaquibacter oligotrophicus TaxID=2880260 RepID=A0ABT6KR26_9MICO|nr:GntR family transcriptional regulator [Antiquaquibacter oligotrophicus]MDH6182230.1 DNA-binding transcriptional regulator YhcF (GntR family) [Antiquaquibacter oligotrophicus]UDF12110.1 GntR family transcriptional regulator [Antiquaquibacter oligotrophicus]